MFNSSLAQEMTAYIELRSAAFSDSLVSNDKKSIAVFRSIFSPSRISGEKPDGRSPDRLGKNAFRKEQNGKKKS